MIEAKLFSYLTSNANVSELVGTRIYPITLPPNYTLPAITYAKISGPKINAKGGATGLAHPRFQFSCWSKSYTEAKIIADTVRLALNAWSECTTYTENELDLYEQDTGLYHVPIDVVIWHAESIVPAVYSKTQVLWNVRDTVSSDIQALWNVG